jgi:hypothetical protein
VFPGNVTASVGLFCEDSRPKNVITDPAAVSCPWRAALSEWSSQLQTRLGLS